MARETLESSKTGHLRPNMDHLFNIFYDLVKICSYFPSPILSKSRDGLHHTKLEKKNSPSPPLLSPSPILTKVDDDDEGTNKGL